MGNQVDADFAATSNICNAVDSQTYTVNSDGALVSQVLGECWRGQHAQLPAFAYLGKVRNGEEVVLEYGRRHEKIAVLVPYEKYRRLVGRQQPRRLGVLEGKGEAIFAPDFKMSDDELLKA